MRVNSNTSVGVNVVLDREHSKMLAIAAIKRDTTKAELAAEYVKMCLEKERALK